MKVESSSNAALIFCAFYCFQIEKQVKTSTWTDTARAPEYKAALDSSKLVEIWEFFLGIRQFHSHSSCRPQTKAQLNSSLYFQECRNLVFASSWRKDTMQLAEMQKHVYLTKTGTERRMEWGRHELWNYGNVSPLD